MRWLVMLVALEASAQSGAQLFQMNCAVGYCHGTAGAANRAPRLAGKSFDKAYLRNAIVNGLPNTAMPGFKGRLGDGQVTALVDYVLGLGSGAAAPPPVPGGVLVESPAFVGPPEAKKGKDVFFDAVRGTRCSTCHLVDGLGIAVGPNLLVNPPANGAALRQAKARTVQMAEISGDRFPALVVEKKKETIQLYDLTVPPPVLRTAATTAVRLSPGSGAWSHADAISKYTDAELDAVAAYLRWLSSR